MPTYFRIAIRSVICILLLSRLFAAYSSASEAAKFGLLLDQSPGIVSQPESGQASEIAQRAAQKANATLEILYLTDDGQIVNQQSAPVNISDYSALWAYQGDTIRQTGPMFSDPVKKQLRARLEAGKPIFLSGGAAALLGALGAENQDPPLKQELAALTFGNDRCQSGLIPARFSDPFWAGLSSDRNAFWFSNAVYPTFAKFVLSGPNVAVWGTNPGGPANPGYVLVCAESAAFCLPVQVSPVYIEADPLFKANFEALVYNILTWNNTPENRAALLSGAVPYDPLPTAALKRAIDDILVQFPNQYPDGKTYLERLAA